jgi:hypothetical protein
MNILMFESHGWQTYNNDQQRFLLVSSGIGSSTDVKNDPVTSCLGHSLISLPYKYIILQFNWEQNVSIIY